MNLHIISSLQNFKATSITRRIATSSRTFTNMGSTTALTSSRSVYSTARRQLLQLKSTTTNQSQNLTWRVFTKRWHSVLKEDFHSRSFKGCNRKTQIRWLMNPAMDNDKPSYSRGDPADFKPRKALIVTKVTRFEFEKNRLGATSDSLLRKALAKRGSDFDSMKKFHDVHVEAEMALISALTKRGVEVRTCRRFNYTDELVDWADVIFSAGGDGTFLMAASKILNDAKPVIGINTDPNRSEGYLCIPKKTVEKLGIDKTVDNFLKGKFDWFLRKRLRTTLIGEKEKISAKAFELQSDQALKYPEYRFVELINETNGDPSDHPLLDNSSGLANGSTKLSKRVLPILALNEIYVGESLSSRVSYLELKFNGDSEWMRTRNSGLCLSTGTGSTSWTFNINKLTQQAVENLLSILAETLNVRMKKESGKTSEDACAKSELLDEDLIRDVTERFNGDIIFDPRENMMAYTIRDPVSKGTFPDRHERTPRGKANRIQVRSRCFDASLVIDGSLSFKFNDGTRAIIEIKDCDALRTIKLNEEID